MQVITEIRVHVQVTPVHMQEGITTVSKPNRVPSASGCLSWPGELARLAAGASFLWDKTHSNTKLLQTFLKHI